MDWKQVGQIVGKYAPLLGSALGGPAGGAIGALVSAGLGVDNSPDAVTIAVKSDPNAAAKLLEIQESNRTVVSQALLQFATAETQEGAQTVREEVKSDSWLAKNWRPITMLSFVVIIINNYIIAPYAQAMFGTSVSLPVPVELWDLIKIGLGGYVVGRSGEKILANYFNAKSGR